MIYGKLVYLRALHEADAGKTIIWRNQIDIKQSACTHPFPVTNANEEEWYKQVLSDRNDKSVYFAICLKSDDSMIGYLFLNQIDWINRHCYWGAIMGDRENQGRGFGSEAVSLVIRYAFDCLNMRIVYANVLSTNPALSKWLRTGAVEEGRLRSHVCQNGSYQDMVVLAWHRDNLVL